MLLLTKGTGLSVKIVLCIFVTSCESFLNLKSKASKKSMKPAKDSISFHFHFIHLFFYIYFIINFFFVEVARG